MHAGVVMQHYLVAMNNDKAVPMLNTAEYLKQHMSAKDLYAHIWNNQGGASFEFFREIRR
jgi:hypothetical protein